jgi:hypothetical protein
MKPSIQSFNNYEIKNTFINTIIDKPILRKTNSFCNLDDSNIDDSNIDNFNNIIKISYTIYKLFDNNTTNLYMKNFNFLIKKKCYWYYLEKKKLENYIDKLTNDIYILNYIKIYFLDNLNYKDKTIQNIFDECIKKLHKNIIINQKKYFFDSTTPIKNIINIITNKINNNNYNIYQDKKYIIFNFIYNNHIEPFVKKKINQINIINNKIKNITDIFINYNNILLEQKKKFIYTYKNKIFNDLYHQINQHNKKSILIKYNDLIVIGDENDNSEINISFIYDFFIQL